MGRLLNLVTVFALALVAASDRSRAQTCDSLLGKTDCGKSVGALSNSRTGISEGPTGLSNQALGRGLSLGGDEQPGMFGAITFGGHGTTCSGPFRIRRC